ncbi:hypothetical protein BP5796_06528 [Coleophoma crateriformis]|uniref:Ubiquitin 3 binding protein But2 C-terminal domain-containing protein n=1 Tax=Coleophoma crateriformis TaxID=565419 RepID=A0A3D8RNR3_9HELO|nr:hypothetical protein BP5796_06528 [Coleophoma crateriformis]
MKGLFVLSSLAAAVFAAPFDVISSRPLTVREEMSLAERNLQGCPAGGTLPASGYLSPTLMVPISAKLPNFRLGPTNNPLVTPNDICTIFNLVIPGSALGKTCTLEFLFPSFPFQTLSPTVYHGAGHFTFTGYAFDSGALVDTTYNTQPPPGPSPPQPPAVLAPGNAYTINVGSCGLQPGQKQMTVSGKLCSTDTTLSYHQSSQTCPIGFFVVIS